MEATVAAAEAALQDLVDGLDLEDDRGDMTDEEGDGIDEATIDEWIDNRLDMSPVEREELKRSLAPVKTLLMKVSVVGVPVPRSSA